MSNIVPIQPQRPRDYTPAQLDLVKRTVAADCNHDEFSLFVEVCKRVGLDPFRKQIYAMVYSKDKPDKRKLSIITGIDGFRAVAARNQDYRPDDAEPVITYRDDLKDPVTNPLGIEKAVVRAFKLAPNGEWHPVVGVAYWDEFAPVEEIWEYSQEAGKRQPSGKFKLGGNWIRMGRIMIVKCAEAQALRKGWPEDLSGVYAPEELARADAEATAAEQVEEYQKEQRQRLIGAHNAIMVQWSAGEPLAPVPMGQFADKCLAFIRTAEDAQLNAWESINRNSLKEFWAASKGDALEIKKAIEARRRELGQQ
jgi:phage recombination protein Bet